MLGAPSNQLDCKLDRKRRSSSTAVKLHAVCACLQQGALSAVNAVTAQPMLGMSGVCDRLLSSGYCKSGWLLTHACWPLGL